MSGRPTKLDELSAKRIVDAIAAGGSRSAAAEAARVHRSTLMGWLARGREGQQPYRDFLDHVKRAEAEAEIEMVTIVRAAAEKGTWQAAAWWLERRRPKTYALRRERPGNEVTMTEEQARTKYRELTGQDWPGSQARDLAVAESVVAALRSRTGEGTP